MILQCIIQMYNTEDLLTILTNSFTLLITDCSKKATVKPVYQGPVYTGHHKQGHRTTSQDFQWCYIILMQS